MEELLKVEDLVVSFPSEKGEVRVVDGVSLEVGKGEAAAVVGESGCGKSMTALSLFRLVPYPGRIVGGRILLKGRDLMQLGEKEICATRGRDLTMVFQDPLSALNPVMTIGAQITEAVHAHEKVSKAEATDRAVEALELVGLPSAKERLKAYPHQFSGGMRQRVLIAMALVCGPSLLVADEPTTAIDVTIQAQILDLLDRLREEKGLAILLITHDLGVVARFAERVYVMYCGRVVEEAPVKDIFQNPAHPYTEGLLASVPGMTGGATRLKAIPGTVPSPDALPPGCSFAPRCPLQDSGCEVGAPPFTPVGEAHSARCFKVEASK